MKINRYTVIAICTITLFACKHKSKTFKDAIRNESENHTDTTRAVSATVAADRLIVPGKSIGGTILDRPAGDVIARLGKPDFSDAAMGKSVCAWYADHNKNGYTTHMYFATDMGNDDTSRVKAIRVSSPSFKTKNQLYAGLLITDAQKQYKLDTLGTFKLNGSSRRLYDDKAEGIAFDADRSGNITGIAVYQKGVNVKNVYMAFFAEVM
ncbi:hypothetical protein ACFS5N_04645 [Mucilaginibacter ximonensis]|uniref:Lipoprotein n=1 Tax=Mucilaginibacter ximonensis TaxID=538021 RepID=A0ABW5Y9S0_9SPHI